MYLEPQQETPYNSPDNGIAVQTLTEAQAPNRPGGECRPALAGPVTPFNTGGLRQSRTRGSMIASIVIIILGVYFPGRGIHGRDLNDHCESWPGTQLSESATARAADSS